MSHVMKHAILYRKNLREAAESFLYAPDTPLTLPRTGKTTTN